MTVPTKILELVERFDRNLDAYYTAVQIHTSLVLARPGWEARLAKKIV
jgi:hypothetical protein